MPKGIISKIADAAEKINKSNVYQAGGKVATGRSATRMAKADLVKAKAARAAATRLPKAVGNIARGVAAGIASKYGAQAEVARANAAAQAAALEKWNDAINQQSAPADGTGDSSDTSESNPSGSTSDTNPTQGPSLRGNPAKPKP